MFEGYNISDTYFQIGSLRNEAISSDGIRVTVNTYHFKGTKHHCDIKVAMNDSLFLLSTVIKHSYIQCNPVTFHIHVSNGIVMGFGPPRITKEYNSSVKTIAAYRYQKPEPEVKQAEVVIKKNGVKEKNVQKTRSKLTAKADRRRLQLQKIKTGKREHDELLRVLDEEKYYKRKRQILELIKDAVKDQFPFFYIVSSPLHKYRYENLLTILLV